MEEMTSVINKSSEYSVRSDSESLRKHKTYFSDENWNENLKLSLGISKKRCRVSKLPYAEDRASEGYKNIFDYPKLWEYLKKQLSFIFRCSRMELGCASDGISEHYLDYSINKLGYCKDPVGSCERAYCECARQFIEVTLITLRRINQI